MRTRSTTLNWTRASLTRPMGRPSRKPKVFYASFMYQAGSWNRPRRVVAKVEWHAGELFPRVGFIVTNLPWRMDRVVRFYNKRGAAEQWTQRWFRPRMRDLWPLFRCARPSNRWNPSLTPAPQPVSCFSSDTPSSDDGQMGNPGQREVLDKESQPCTPSPP